MSIVEDYLNYTKKWKQEYGEKTIVLMQIGSFFEVYALKNPDGSYSGSNIEEFASINDFVIADKHTCVGKFPVRMAGFGLTQIDKYVRKLQEHDYTIVIYKQDVNGKNTTRSLAEVISPGTYFGQETQELSNNTMAIWLDNSACGRGKTTSKYFRNSSGGASSLPSTASEIAIGVATLDIFTGKTSLFQFSVDYNHNPLTYDELERYVSAYKPSECLIITNITEDHVVNDIISFVGLDSCRKIHKVGVGQQSEKSAMVKCAINAEKQTYQKEVLSKFYPALSDTILMDALSTHYIAIQAFCFLLDFVYQHSPSLLRKLSMPKYETHADKLILANHSLKQLNIIDDSRHTGKHRSVSSLLNNCVTTMGKRMFMYTLNNPSTNIDKLNASYDITEHLLKENSMASWPMIRKELSTIKDIEKLGRKLAMGKIAPKDFALLAYDLQVIGDLYSKLKDDLTLNAYIQEQKQESDIQSLCTEIVDDLTKTFALDKCYDMTTIEAEQQCFVNKGISSTIDALMEDSIGSREKLEAIRAYFSDIIKSKEKKEKKEKETEYIKLHEPARSDAVLMATSRRMALLKSELSKMTKTMTNVDIVVYSSIYSLHIDDLMYESVGSNSMIVTNAQIKQISSSVQNSKDKLVQELLVFFNNYITEFSQRFEHHLEEIKNYITLLDLLQCKCYIAHTYNYCKPGALPSVALAPHPRTQKLPSQPHQYTGESASTKQEGKFFPPTIAPYMKFTGIRHPLIEHIQTNELYVTNDLFIGGSAPLPPYAKLFKTDNPEGVRGQGGRAPEEVRGQGGRAPEEVRGQGGRAPEEVRGQGGRAPEEVRGQGGRAPAGVLLFGTNAVGKTSFIKSVGIAVVMAQAGLYVPCTTFEYKPYSYIFTRILGNDNLFKGLSTFAVEMSELRTILLQANENSLVLGDELCSGTESDSALSIFTAGLEHLHEKGSTFLFATHFHEIVKFDEIKALDRLTMKHMAVTYDLENSVLIYDRKLKDGPGDSNYGLEVCKSLHLPDAFLQRADEIRMKYNKSKQNILSFTGSHFNAKKIVGCCELCKDEKASEVHHLQHQANANKTNNYIDTFHKNHVANLLNICETCHKKIHGTNKQHKVVKALDGTYKLKEI